MPPTPVTALTIDQLLQQYCVLAAPASADQAEVAPQLNTRTAMANHRVEAYIDGPDYFAAIGREIDGLLANANGVDRFFFLSAWWLGLVPVTGPVRVEDSWTYTFDPNFPNAGDADVQKAFLLPGTNQPLIQRLTDLANAGVDVRVLAWVLPFIGNQTVATKLSIADINYQTLLSVDALRQQLPQPGGAMLNMLAHSMGAAHHKLVIAGERANTNPVEHSMRAYVAGLDPQIDRLEASGLKLKRDQFGNLALKNGKPYYVGGWHDVGVKVEGIAASQIYRFFKNQWDEQLARPIETFTLNGRPIPSHDRAWQLRGRDPVASAPNLGRQYVQVLRTVPRMRFNEAGPVRRGQLLVPSLPAPLAAVVGTYVNQRGFRRPPLGFAPNGLFEFKVALKHAIDNAQNYIFIADQAMYGMEIMDWIQARLLANPALKVILLYGADPKDPPNAFLAEAMDAHLAPGLPTDQSGYVAPVRLYEWIMNAVHCKVAIVDDCWCAIGSANCMRRSLYTDIELSVAICEPPTPDAALPSTIGEERNLANGVAVPGKQAPSFVQRFRRDLWAHYCDLRPPDLRHTQLLQLDRALAIWEPSWGNRLQSVHLREYRDLDATLQGSPNPWRPEIAERLLPTYLQHGGSAASRMKFRQIVYDSRDADSRQPF